MAEKTGPSGIALAGIAFGALLLLESLSYWLQMAPVWYYRNHADLATRIVLQCNREHLTEPRCYEASEALNPRPPAPAGELLAHLRHT